MAHLVVIRQSVLTLSLVFAIVLTGPRPMGSVEPLVVPTTPVGADSERPQKTSGVSAAGRAGITNALARLPLSFEPNRGQSPSDVEFLARTAAYLLQLTATDVRMIVLGGPEHSTRATTVERARAKGPAPSHVLTFTWLDADRYAGATPESALPGIVNYLKGGDPAKWRTGIPTYARVRYHDIYPGIDVVYYGNGRELEYDLVVAPHADPGAVRLSLEGADPTLTEGGNLELSLSNGRVLQLRAPLAYQERDGQRVAVEAGYRLSTAKTGTEVSFRVAAYDPELPLVIDPLVYSTFLGGSGDEWGWDIAVNAANEAFVTGSTADASTDFPATGGAFDTSHNGNSDVFVTRLNSTGTALVYSTFLGGSGDESASGIAVNAADEAFVTGGTSNGTTLFPTTVGAFDTSYNGGFDAFVTRLNSVGTGLVYSTFLGGSASDWGRGIAVNAASEAFVTGATDRGLTDFPTTAGAFDTSHGGGPQDAFVTRLNSTGTALVYSSFLGGSGQDFGNRITVNAANEAFVVGDTTNVNYSGIDPFPTTAGAFDTSHNGLLDAFVTRLNSNGSALIYSTFLGGSNDDWGAGIAVSAADEAFVTGTTQDAVTDFPTTPGAFDTTLNGLEDAYVARLSSTGTALVYSTFLGGRSYDGGLGIAVNAAGEAFVTGATAGATDFPTTAGAFDTSYNGGPADAFVTRLNSTGTALVYSTFLGGSGYEFGNGIAVNIANEAFVIGRTGDDVTDFPTTVGAFDTTHNGSFDAFVVRVTTDPPAAPESPTNLRVTGMAGNSVTFRWNPPTSGLTPTGFQIEGGLLPGQVMGSLPLGPAPLVTVALPTGSFYVRVRSLLSGLPSAPSNEVLAHVNVAMPPSAPANLLGLVVGNSVNLAWTNTFRGGPPSTVTLDVTGTVSASLPLGLTESFSFAGVPPGTYTLTVRAANTSGSSVASNPVTLTFPGACSGTPQPATNYVAYNVGRTIFVSWDTAASGPAPTGFVLNVTGALAASVPTPLRALSGAVPAGTYNLSVVATNPCGASAPTAVLTVPIP